MAASPPATTSALIETFTLGPREELRFEVSFRNTVQLSITSGHAEIFGAELAVSKAYSFTGTKLALFSWQGCHVQLEGECDVCYKAEETPMSVYINVHSVVQMRRKLANELLSAGPRVLVVGPPSSGKTTLCAILVGYMLKANQNAFFVDMDVSRGSITVPGTMSASLVEHIEPGVGPMFDRPLSLFFGHTDVTENGGLYQQMATKLGEYLDSFFSKQKALDHLGFIVNAPSTTIEKGYQETRHLIEALKINVVLVIGAERLYANLLRDCQDRKEKVECVHVPKSGGVVTREDAFLHKMMTNRFKAYFYGPNNEFNPFTMVLDMDQYKMFRVGSGHKLPDSALPIGAVSSLNPLDLETVDLSPSLIHSVLGVSQATQEDQIIGSPVHGFCHVSKVDMDRRKLTVLSPSPGTLPGKFLLLGSIKWLES